MMNRADQYPFDHPDIPCTFHARVSGDVVALRRLNDFRATRDSELRYGRFSRRLWGVVVMLQMALMEQLAHLDVPSMSDINLFRLVTYIQQRLVLIWCPWRRVGAQRNLDFIIIVILEIGFGLGCAG